MKDLLARAENDNIVRVNNFVGIKPDSTLQAVSFV